MNENDSRGSRRSATAVELLAWQPSAALVARVDRYLAQAATVGSQAVLHAARMDLHDASSQEWGDVARQILQRGQPLFAAALLQMARQRDSADSSLRYWLAQAFWQDGDSDRAEAELRALLAGETHMAASQLLAEVLRAQGRLRAAASCMAAVARQMGDDTNGVLACIQFVRGSHQHELAAELCTEQRTRGTSDPRLHAVAGQIEQELGHFDQARACYSAALESGVDVNAWFVPGSLASLQRYSNRQHSDFALFETQLRNRALSPRARASILFAKGKACDDIGAYADAAEAWQQANALTRQTVNWSRARWTSFVKDRLAAPSLQAISTAQAPPTPIFVVGLPRTGTTLTAELLGRCAGVCNRGELPTLEFLAQRLASLAPAQRQAHLHAAAEIYLAHLRRDDPPATCYVDKNPLNFRYLDQVAAMFPQARVIHCRRQPRDTALSIWSQPFAHDDYAFARDFADIAAMMEGCDVLMAHWRQTLRLPIITVEYEHLVTDASATMTALLPHLGLSSQDPLVEPAASGSITSASMWQARQPVHRRSVSRWRHYAELLPELVQLFAET